MGCSISKEHEASNDVVSLCGDRKRLAKAAVERRKAFAEAHCNYIRSLSAVSSAIAVFVARYSSSPNSPFPEITVPASQNQNSVDTHQALVQTSYDSWSVASGSSDEGGESTEVCEYFYGDNHQSMPSPGRVIGWDFFNLLDNPPPLPMAVPGKKQVGASERGDRKLGKKKRETSNMESKTLGEAKRAGGEDKVSGKRKEVNGSRELLVALKDLEQHFARAYESGISVSRMLEVNKPHLQPVLEEIQENSSKFLQPNPWNRSPSSQSSSCKSLISSSSKSSSTWADSRSELFDGAGGMESGSHSFTLGRLYAWEKKLYEEVKAAEQTTKSYQQKCSQLRKQQGVGEDSEETAEITSVYNRILVARRSLESISKQIEKLRDEELQPQLVELLHGLMRTWKIMSESHEIQNKIMSEVKSFTCPNGMLCNDSHRLATLQLEKELKSWQSSFSDYISTQKAYVMSLHGWLSKLIDPGVDGRSSSLPAFLINGPTLLIACQNWLTSLERVPEKAVKFSMKTLVKDVHELWVQQGEEQETKKKVDGLVKELDRKALALKREEGRVLPWKPTIQKFRGKERNSAEDLIGRKNLLDTIRIRLDSEKVKHQSTMQRTQQATLDGLKMGFSSVFESLTDFSRASVKLYADLVTFCENSDGGQ